MRSAVSTVVLRLFAQPPSVQKLHHLAFFYFACVVILCTWRYVDSERRGIAATGVDVASFRREGSIPDEWLRRRKQTLNEFKCNKLIVYVGRVSYEKAVNELYHLFDHPGMGTNKVALWVIGDGPHLSDLKVKY